MGIKQTLANLVNAESHRHYLPYVYADHIVRAEFRPGLGEVEVTFMSDSAYDGVREEQFTVPALEVMNTLITEAMQRG